MIFRWPALVLVVLVASCASLAPPGPETSRLSPGKADCLLAHIRSTNKKVTPYKAIGRIRVEDSAGAWSVRAAWMTAPGGCFRVEALGLAGQPFAKVICNPDRCAFHLLENGQLRKKNTGRRSLAPLAGVDIRIDDLGLLLAGGVPLIDYDAAAAYETDTGSLMLELKKRFSGTGQRLLFDPDSLDIREIKIFGRGEVAYRVRIPEMLASKGRRVPARLEISDPDGHFLRLTVERFWTDAAVSKKVFSPEFFENRDGTAP